MTVYFEDVAPVFPVGDMEAAMAHYRELGFGVSSHNDRYAYAVRGGVTIHLTLVEGLEPLRSSSVAYLLVEDAEALAQEWEAADVDGEIRSPAPTDYGAIEGAYVDPDGNMLRFGSPQDED